jgi:hypothetical protein
LSNLRSPSSASFTAISNLLPVAWHNISLIIGILLSPCYSPDYHMTENDYRTAFERAKSDYDEAVHQKQQADAAVSKATQDVVRLRRAVVALAAMCGEDNYEEKLGLTEAVRLVFVDRDGLLTLPQIKDLLEGLGVSFADLKNPDASVMSVLSRLTTTEWLTRSQRPNPSGMGIRNCWGRKKPPLEGKE